MWITNGHISDVAVVICSAGKDSRGHNILQRVIIEREHTPYETRKIDCIGLRQGHMAEIFFDNCRVPKQNALNEGGDLARLLGVTWHGNRALLGLMAVGMARQALDAAIQYAGIRRQFGRIIGGTQLIQERLADISTAVETSSTALLQGVGTDRPWYEGGCLIGNGETLCNDGLFERDIASYGNTWRHGAERRTGAGGAFPGCSHVVGPRRHE